MKARLPEKGKAVSLEDCIKSEFRKFVKENGKDRMFEIFDYMLSRKYIDSFEHTSSMEVKKEVNKLIGEPFKEELDMAWKRMADKGKSEEEMLQEMSNIKYIEDNLGRNIPKTVKDVLQRELARYIKLKEKAIEEAKNKEKMKNEIKENTLNENVKENPEKEPETVKETIENTEKEEVIEEPVEINDKESEPAWPKKTRKAQIDENSKLNEQDIEFYNKVYAFTDGFKSLVKPGYMYDVEYGRRTDSTFGSFKQYNRFLRIQEIVKLARSKYKMNEYQAIKELLKKKNKKIDPVTKAILEGTVKAMEKNEYEVNRKFDSDIDM